jgi:hypothetical protein
MERLYCLAVALLVSHSAWASDISAEARCMDLGYSVQLFYFRVEHLDSELPKGSKLELVHAYGGAGFHGELPDAVEMVTDESGASRTEYRFSYMMVGGHYYTHLEFSFKITLPTGEVIWDRGNMGEKSFYKAFFFHPKKLPCYKMAEFQALDLSVDPGIRH